MGAEDEGGVRRRVVHQGLPDAKVHVRVQFVTDAVPYQERVPVLWEDGGFERDGEFRFVHQGVPGVPEQSVAGVVAGNFGDVQLLLLAVEVPRTVLDAVCPRCERDSRAARRDVRVAVRFGQVHARPRIEPQSGSQLGNDGDGVTSPEFELAAGGVSARCGFGSGCWGRGRIGHGNTVLVRPAASADVKFC